VSIHPSGRFVLVANYFGGSVAVLPLLGDGRLGAATAIKHDTGTLGPTCCKEVYDALLATAGRRARVDGVSHPRT
jgi:hypothetical protein